MRFLKIFRTKSNNIKNVEIPNINRQLFCPLHLYGIVVVVVFLLDMATKGFVTQTMDLYQSIPLINDILKLTYVRNTGAAFSLLADFDSPARNFFLISVKAVAIIVLTGVAYHERHGSYILMLPLGLVCAGALGNLVNRISTGTVIDFIEVGYGSWHFPVFNLADSSVVIGASWLALMILRKQAKPPDASD